MKTIFKKKSTPIQRKQEINPKVPQKTKKKPRSNRRPQQEQEHQNHRRQNRLLRNFDMPI